METSRSILLFFQLNNPANAARCHLAVQFLIGLVYDNDKRMDVKKYYHNVQEGGRSLFCHDNM